MLNCVKMIAIDIAQVAELVDAIDSKSIDGNIMRVRFSPWAHFYMKKTKKQKKISQFH